MRDIEEINKNQIAIGSRIQEIRQSKGATQEKFASWFENLSIPTLGRYERGVLPPSTEFLLALNQKFETSIDYILLGKTDTQKGRIEETYSRVSRVNKLGKEDFDILMKYVDEYLEMNSTNRELQDAIQDLLHAYLHLRGIDSRNFMRVVLYLNREISKLHAKSEEGILDSIKRKLDNWFLEKNEESISKMKSLQLLFSLNKSDKAFLRDYIEYTDYQYAMRIDSNVLSVTALRFNTLDRIVEKVAARNTDQVLSLVDGLNLFNLIVDFGQLIKLQPKLKKLYSVDVKSKK